MSISKTFATSQPDFDLFAPSWQAGLSGSQCLTKSLKNYDIESVNIVKTCEKLCLALKENSKSDTPQCVSKDDEMQCTVRTSSIPFRACSNIWFGTLKIYQQQVNTLFRLSRDLYSRSCDYKDKHLKASKRKSSLKSQIQLKKRRLTLSESNEKRYLTTNYSELLDDLERLTQEPLQKSLEEFSQCISGTITQYHVREITIREISATTHNSLDVVDEDSGFGEATYEEIAEFFNFIGDNSMINNKRSSTKRKTTCEQGSPKKKSCHFNDSSVEPLESTPLTNISSSSFKRSITPTRICNTLDKNINVLTQNFMDNDLIETDKIKKEDLLVIENKEIAKIHGANKENNLIIDERTKIDMTEIIEEMKTSKLLTKMPRRNILKSYKSKRNKTALELLTRFNRRSFKLSLSLKQKFYISREQFEKDYLNLLREIFKSNYNEKWASEIYPNWIYFEDILRKQNKKQSVTKSRKKEYVLQPKLDIKNEVPITNEMDVNNFNEYQEMKTLNTCVHNEWRPYSVMMKLLNLWRFNQTNKIAAMTLFKLAENPIDRALGFNSLLNLSKKRFVNLTTFPESIKLENILMGKAIKSNINNFA